MMSCLSRTSHEHVFTLLLASFVNSGAVPSPFDCYLVNRGLKTLSVRMRQHMSSGLRIAQHLEKHPNVEHVIYPPLESHPQHDLYKKQMTGFTGMISIYLKGDEVETSKKFLKHLTVREQMTGLLHTFLSRFVFISYFQLLNHWEVTNHWWNFQPS
jgi:cystathionine gamma-lyase